MAMILTSLRNTVIAGFVLAFLLELMYLNGGGMMDTAFYAFLFRWLHVLAGIMWIGLLYYFNFVQIPNMPNIPDEQKPAVSKVIAPAALVVVPLGGNGNGIDRSHSGLSQRLYS